MPNQPITQPQVRATRRQEALKEKDDEEDTERIVRP